MYRGKRRCPTCGVPSLICRECFLADKGERKNLGRGVRCDLCIEQGIMTNRRRRKPRVRTKHAAERFVQARRRSRASTESRQWHSIAVDKFVSKENGRIDVDGDLSRNHSYCMEDRSKVWKYFRTSIGGNGATGRCGVGCSEGWEINVLSRPIYISFQAPGGKNSWPPKSSAVRLTTEYPTTRI
jgi:hypothetical protein